MKIVTGVSDSAHVTSKEFRKIMEGVFGRESYILSSGDNMRPEMVSNNLLKIFSGAMCHHGNISSVDSYDEIEVANGTQGVRRIDLVANRYKKDGQTGIESNEWVVIQGTPAQANPVAPECTASNMQEGALIDDCPVFEIHFDGINVIEIKTLLEMAPGIDGLKKEDGNVFDKIYPVGSYYIAHNGTSPAELFGGTWTRVAGYFLYGEGDSTLLGNTGGEAAVTLNESEMPKHAHMLGNNGDFWYGQDWGGGAKLSAYSSGQFAWNPSTLTTGGSQPHNNMPPYIRVAIWRRIA